MARNGLGEFLSFTTEARFFLSLVIFLQGDF
jgi:hypothetical protein